MQTEAQRRAKQRYDAKTAFAVYLKLNKNTDQDIIEWLQNLENKQGYIKGLIRSDMAKSGHKSGHEKK